jgi:predicted DsbA family dithiol-disulfide isomerase
LEAALRLYQERRPDEEKPAVRWLPFQLNPDLPEEGIPRKEYLEGKFGPGHSHSYARVASVGREVGIEFAFDRITVQPNTLNAHRLMIYGAKQGREDEVAENLFRAYFLEGANLTDQAALARVGERAGLDRTALVAYLASEDGREEVLRADLEARQAGIHGVPCFIFNRRTTVSGAQAPETLLQAMLDAGTREEE